MPHPAPLNSHTLPITPGCDCGAPVHDGPHDAALSAEQKPMSTEACGCWYVSGIPDKSCKTCGGAGLFPERRPPLRVFTFEGVAYQVDARARYADIHGCSSIVRVDGRAGVKVSRRKVTGEVYGASRLSLASDWIAFTLRKAAHDYLDAYLSARESSAIEEYRALRWALRRIERSYCCRKISHSFSGPYGDRVRADIEARLRGEPGEVIKP